MKTRFAVVTLLMLVGGAFTALPAAAASSLTIRPGANGLPAQMAAPEFPKGGLLAAPCRLLLVADGKALPVPPLHKVSADAWTAEWPEQHLRIGVKYGHGAEPVMSLTVENLAADARTVGLQLQVPILPQADRAFFPAGDKPHVALAVGADEVKYGYGGAPGTGLALPLGSVYSPDGDLGLALFGDHTAPIPAFGLAAARSKQATTVNVLFSGLTCEHGAAVTRLLFLAPTRGDWRPALAADLKQFPKVFEPQNPGIAALQGPFVCSGGTPSDKSIADWYAQGTRVLEIHGTAPFYGLYVPDHEPFVPFCDDAWHFLKKRIPENQWPPANALWQDIRKFVEAHEKPTMTRDKVRDYIKRLHQHGIKGLIYFNPTEAWAPFAAARFASDRVMRADGTPAPAWYESVCMHPDINRPWGKYILSQLRGELEDYPNVDGVFFDQSANGGHDLTALCAEGARMVRAHGGICWWNGPYNAELAALADGMMSEGGGTSRYRAGTNIIQYYGIAGKPIVSLGPATPEAYAELLSHGLIPQPVGLSQHDIEQRWFPLFRWFRNRQWVLTAHALRVPDDVTANLYRTPDGNYVVPMTLPDATEDSTAASARFRFGIQVDVRVADAADLKAAYLLTPSLLGYHKLAMHHAGDRVSVTVPRLREAGLLVLAKTGVFASLNGAGASLAVVRDAGSAAAQKPNARLILDNWTGKAVSAAVSVQGRNETYRLAPGRSTTMDVAMPIPSGNTEQRLSIPVEAKVGGTEMGGPNELWIDDPFVIQLDAPSHVRDDETVRVQATVIDHATSAARVKIKPTSSFLIFTPAERTIALTPNQPATLTFEVKPTRAGTADFHVEALDGNATAEATGAIDVYATALAPGGLQAIRAADLSLDVFGSDGGSYANKPIQINGVTIGLVPQETGDNWMPDCLVPLPPAAITALKKTNTIEIGNRVGDAFKVRNLQLILRMHGGITAVSAIDHGAYTGSTGWLYGEGKQFETGKPLTGIAVRIPIGPNRHESYEEVFGKAKSGKLVIEVNGADSGVYAHKPVSVNGCPIGDLPPAGNWTEESIPLTADALASLSAGNAVVIENSDPPDAFKVRRARIEIENTEGKRFVTATEQEPYTSVGWEFAEGKIGSPIRFVLKFAGK